MSPANLSGSDDFLHRLPDPEASAFEMMPGS
jgi:hypothetical protein